MVEKQPVTGSCDLALLVDVAEHDDALDDGVQRQHHQDDGKGVETTIRNCHIGDEASVGKCNVVSTVGQDCRGCFKGGEVL